MYRAQLPYVCLLAALIMLCFPGPLSLPGGLSLGIVACFIATAASANAAWRRSRPLLDSTSSASIAIILASGAFLVVWSTISVIDAREPIRAGRVIATHVSGALLLLMIYATFTPQRARGSLDIIASILAFISFLVLLAYFFAPLKPIFFHGTDRAQGFFKNPNQYGMVLSTITPVVLGMALSEKRSLIAVGRFALLVTISFGIVASGSKTNLLLFTGSAFVVLCIAPFIQQRGIQCIFQILRNLGCASLVLLLGLATLEAFNPRALRILQEFLVNDGQVKSLVSRELLWDYSLDQFLKDPLLGEGAGQKLGLWYKEIKEEVPHSHNVVLDYMRALGMPGLAAIGLILIAASYAFISTIVLALRARFADASHRLTAVGLGIGGLSYLLANMSSDSFGPTTSPFFWIVTYFAFLMRRELHKGMPVHCAKPPMMPQPA